MGNFWPDVDINDTASPIEILEDANAVWQKESAGVLSLDLQVVDWQGGIKINVYGRESRHNRSIALFSVAHRAQQVYPASLIIPEEEIPVYLQKTYTVPGGLTHYGAIAKISKLVNEDKVVENRWVCDDPIEFRIKLNTVLNMGIVKSSIYNLMRKPPNPSTKAKSASPTPDNSTSEPQAETQG